MELSENFNNSINNAFSVIDSNRILTTVLSLFLILYAALAAPVLPLSITRVFKNTWFKLAFMFLIAYAATKNPTVAIISSVALLVTLQTLANQETTNSVVLAVENKIDQNIEYFGEVSPADDVDNEKDLVNYAPAVNDGQIIDAETLQSQNHIYIDNSEQEREVAAVEYQLDNNIDMTNYVIGGEGEVGEQVQEQQYEEQQYEEKGEQTEEKEEEQREEEKEDQREESNETEQEEKEEEKDEELREEQETKKPEAFNNNLEGFNYENLNFESINNEIKHKHSREKFQDSEIITGTCGDESMAVAAFETGEYASW